MRAFYQMLKMDFCNLCTPSWILYNTLFPTALIGVLGFLTLGSYSGGVSSFDYYGITMLIFAALNTATMSANSFLEERVKKPNLRIMHAPVEPACIPLSKLIASFLFCFITHAFTIGVLHFVLGVQLGGITTVLALTLLLFLLELFAAALGIAVCCVLKSESAANQIISLLAALLAALGGLFFPVEGLGRFMAIASNFSPVKWIAVSAFQMIYDGDFGLLWPVCGVLLGLSALCALFSAKHFHTEDYL